MRGSPSTFYRCLNRKFLIAGMEKEMLFLILGLSAPLAFSSGFRISMCLFALVIFFVFAFLARALAKADPDMRKIYLKHIRYKRYYPPICGLLAQTRMIKDSVPVYNRKG